MALLLRCWRVLPLPLGLLLVIGGFCCFIAHYSLRCWQFCLWFVAELLMAAFYVVLLRVVGQFSEFVLVINGGFCLYYSIAPLRCLAGFAHSGLSGAAFCLFYVLLDLPLGSLLIINGGFSACL
jgi:hypothetical protein